MNTRSKRSAVKANTDVAVDVVENEAKTDVKAEIKAKFEQVVEDAKSRSQENRLVMLGAIANARKAREERKANLIEAGRAYEPELQAKIDELKSKFKFGDDTAKKTTKGDKAEPGKLQARVASGFERLGLPTRKDFDALSKKVDKLIELQRA